MTDLKPCPFCGRVPIIEDCGEHRWFIRCECGIAQDKLYAQRCDAVRRWNRRKTEPQTEIPCENCQEWDCYGCDYKQAERSR